MSQLPTALSGEPLPDDVPTLMPVYGTRGLYGGALDDEKGRISFLRDVVTEVRRCPEMGRYRSFLLEHLDLDRCSVLSGLTAEECAAARLELHHWPLSLFDVCSLVLGQMEADGERITTFAVAHRAMALHWRGMVGLVPLLESLHQMAHSGQLRLDPRWAFGNWQGLLDECRSGLSEELATRLRAEFASWGQEGAGEENARVLEVRPLRWTSLPPTAARLLTGPGEDGDGSTAV